MNNLKRANMMNFGTKGCMHCEGECNKECLPKKETLEEVSENAFSIFQNENPIIPSNHIQPFTFGFMKGAKWQSSQQDQFAIKFGVWLSANCLQDTTKDGWWLYQNTLLTTDECLTEFKYEHLNGNS